MQRFQPTLIFSERHDDPVTIQTLHKLLPYFSEHGYTHFLNERPGFFSLKDTINDYVEEENKYQKLLRYTEKWKHESNNKFDLNLNDIQTLNASTRDNIILFTGLCLTEESWLLTFHRIWEHLSFWKKPEHPFTHFLRVLTIKMEEAAANRKDFFEECKKLIITITYHTNRLVELALLRDLPPTISYQAMDHSWTYLTSDPTSEAGMAARDKHMAAHLLSKTSPVFARIGVAHAYGIQERILEKFSQTEASARFCFFNLYSIEDKIDSDVCNKPHPLGLVRINVAGKSDEEVFQLIVNEIEKRQLQLLTLAEAKQQQEDEHLNQLIPYAEHVFKNGSLSEGGPRVPDMNDQEKKLMELLEQLSISLGHKHLPVNRAIWEWRTETLIQKLWHPGITPAQRKLAIENYYQANLADLERADQSPIKEILLKILGLIAITALAIIGGFLLAGPIGAIGLGAGTAVATAGSFLLFKNCSSTTKELFDQTKDICATALKV